MKKSSMRMMFLAIAFSSATVVAEPIDRVVVISDSLADTGNLSALTGGLVPQVPPYAEGRFSNGDVWVDYLGGYLGLAVNEVWGLDVSDPLNPTPTVTPLGDGNIDNFAVAGSFTGSYAVAAPFGSGEIISNVFDFYAVLTGAAPLGVPGASEQFLAYAATGIDPSAPHVLWAGSNDLLYSPFLDPTTPTSGAALAAFAANAAGNVVDIAAGLAAAGVADLVVLNLPDLGATPYADFNTPGLPVGAILADIFPSAEALSAYLSAASQLFNLELATQLATAGVDATLFDLAATFQDLLTNPQDYGITEVENPCLQAVSPDAFLACANPEEYLFWDDVHPTTAVHEILAGQLLAEIAVPQPLPLLALGLAAALMQKRRSSKRH
jgi:phospholipase/lecithinase/hemolysin